MNAACVASHSRRISRRSLLGHLATSSALASIAVALPARQANAQSTPASARETPNTYRLAGDGVEIAYASTSMTGQPTVTYRSGPRNLSFAGPQVREDTTPFGNLVTVVIDSVADGYSDELTVVLPQVNLTGDNEPTEFSTFAIVTRHRTTIAGPGMLEGQIQSYDVMQLEGTAEILWY